MRFPKTNFLDSPVGKTLFFKSLPMFLGIFAHISYNLVDTFFVAKLGTKQLAAMSFSFPVVMILLNIMFGIGTAASSIISRKIGEKSIEEAKKGAIKSLQLTTLFSFIIIALGILTIKPLFTFLGAGPDLMGYISDYMIIWYIGAPFINLSVVSSSIFRAKGNIFYPSAILFFGAIFNAILDPILIFGLGPIPAFGVQGAAITTVLGNLVAVLLIARKFKKDEEITPLSLFSPFDFPLFKTIMAIAVPTALANSFVPLSTAFTNRLLVNYSDAAVAANSIATRVEMVPFIAIFALSSVIAPFVGQNWGAKNYARIREGLKKSFLFSYVLGTITASFIMIKKEMITKLFDSSSEVVGITSSYFSMIPLTYGILGTVFLANHSLTAIGKAFAGNFLSAARLVILYAPLALLFNYYLEIPGIFLARFIANSTVGLFATGMIYYVFFKKTRPVVNSFERDF